MTVNEKYGIVASRESLQKAATAWMDFPEICRVFMITFAR